MQVRFVIGDEFLKDINADRAEELIYELSDILHHVIKMALTENSANRENPVKDISLHIE